MKNIVEIDNNRFEIIKDYREGFIKEEFINRYTDYFDEYDYVVGDWAYGKLRLKGFYDDENEKSSPLRENFRTLRRLESLWKVIVACLPTA